jgi:hypothetical protein
MTAIIPRPLADPVGIMPFPTATMHATPRGVNGSTFLEKRFAGGEVIIDRIKFRLMGTEKNGVVDYNYSK